MEQPDHVEFAAIGPKRDFVLRVMARLGTYRVQAAPLHLSRVEAWCGRLRVLNNEKSNRDQSQSETTR